MRDLKRNQMKVYYKNLIAAHDDEDEWGNLTATQTLEYGELKSVEISVSGNKGDVENQPFGVELDYDRTLSTANTECDIDEFSVLWVERDPELTYNYKVVKVSRTLNQALYAIKAVDVSENS